ncbi:copper resistance CopC/CopD family protein [Streptomyces sp. NPDC059786]|uniref:copper resistance CopC/CopD family protein n=1 Tax=Streptomyces sp. NPDC059786 TaxID=3346946 RepID=UPI003659EF38
MLLCAVLVLFLLGGAGPASAHAVLTGSDPRDGTVLKSAPRHITLTFTESVGLLDDSFRVLDPGNRRVRTGDAGHAGGRSATARVTLPRDLGTGTFTVAWRVVSADSHPISGAFTFSVGRPSDTSAVLPAEATGGTVAGTLYDAARYVAYTAVALLVGAATFAVVTGCGGVRRLLVTGWWALVLATVALLLLRAPYERGSGLTSVFDPSALAATLTGRPGIALLARLALLAAAALLPVRGPGGLLAREPEDPGPGPGHGGVVVAAAPKGVVVSGGLLAVGLAGTWAAAEHASAGIQVPVAMTSAVLHLLAMAVWLGGLAALLTALHRIPDDLLRQAPLRRTVGRFSRLAFAAVTVLVATGVYQSWRGLGSLDAFATTSYGRILTVKLMAVVLVLTAAAYSRRWAARLLTAADRPAAATARVPQVPQPVGAPAPPEDAASDTVRTDAPDAVPAEVPAGDGPAYRRALWRSVLAEVVIGVVVLVITTVLTGTQPGRAEAETAAASEAAVAGRPTDTTSTVPFDMGTSGGRGKVQIDLAPGRVGDNTVQAVVFGADGGLATVPELRLSFTLAAQDIGPIDANLTDKGGYWGTDAVNLPLSGSWTMRITVRTTDIDQVTVERTVRIE